MDKWSTLKEVLIYDQKIADESISWKTKEPEANEYWEHLSNIIDIYLGVMEELEAEELRLYEGIVGRERTAKDA